MGLATLSVLLLSPKFLIHIMKTDHTAPQGSRKAGTEIELQLQVRAQLPLLLFAIYVRNLPGPVSSGSTIFITLLSLLSDLYNSRSVICFCSTDKQM